MSIPELDAMVHDAIARRGIDPARIDACPSLINPLGNVMDAAEAVEFRLAVAQRKLRKQAAGEFDLDRLPEVDPKVAWWVEQHKQDPQHRPWMLLRGSIGSGKTSQVFCALRSLAYHYAQQNVDWRWEFITNRELAAGANARDQRDVDALVTDLQSADLTCLDDLGAFNNSDFGKAAEVTARIVEHRSRYRLPTIYDSNLPFERTAAIKTAEHELGRQIPVLADIFDDRILSRLRHRDTVVMTTPEIDYRRLRGDA